MEIAHPAGVVYNAWVRRRLPVLLLLPIAVVTAALARDRVEVRNEILTPAYRTFGFGEGTPARNADVQKHILAAVERELEANGLQRDDYRPHLRVITHVIVERHELAELDDPDFWEYWLGVDAYNAFQLQAGTLVVDLVDVGQEKIVWRGVASAKVSGSLKANFRHIDRLVQKLFRGFGPR